MEKIQINKIKITNIIYLIVPLFVLHLLEELMTGFYGTDSSVNHLSDLTNFTPQIIFFLIEIVMFSFLAVLLVIILIKKPLPLFLIFILGIISLYEFSHVIEAVKLKSYSSGLITGAILGIFGVILLLKVIKRK